GVIFHTRPTPVVPSPVQRLPFQSKPSPLVPGTPLANTVAVGGLSAFGVKRKMRLVSVTYTMPSGPIARPLGEHDVVALGAGTRPTITSAGLDSEIFHTGQGSPALSARPGVYRLPLASLVRPSIAMGVVMSVENVVLGSSSWANTGAAASASAANSACDAFMQSS